MLPNDGEIFQVMPINSPIFTRDGLAPSPLKISRLKQEQPDIFSERNWKTQRDSHLPNVDGDFIWIS